MAKTKALTEQGFFAQRDSAARDARKLVSEQFVLSLAERRMAGDEAIVGRRLREMLEAKRSGDRDAYRAAVMEVALAAGELCVALDLERGSLPSHA